MTEAIIKTIKARAACFIKDNHLDQDICWGTDAERKLIHTIETAMMIGASIVIEHLAEEDSRISNDELSEDFDLSTDFERY